MALVANFADWAASFPATWQDVPSGDYGFVQQLLPQNVTMQHYYAAVAAGTVTPSRFEDLFTEENLGLKAGEFGLFSPEVQAWARTHVQAFVQALLAHRNPANQDLGSVGAEGGYSNLGNVTVGANGLDYTSAGYLAVHDESGLGGLGALLAVAAAIYTGGTALGWFGAGAAGTTGTVAGSIAYGTCDITVAEMTALGYTPAVASTAIDTLAAIETTTGGTIPTVDQLMELGYSQTAAETVVTQLEVSAANGAALAASGDAAMAAGEAAISASADAAIAAGDVAINAGTQAALDSLAAASIPNITQTLKPIIDGLKTVGMTPTQAVMTALKLFTQVTTGGKTQYVRNGDPATYGQVAGQYGAGNNYGIVPSLTPALTQLMLPLAIVAGVLITSR